MPGQSIKFGSPAEENIWWKTIAFDNGISPREFNNITKKDLQEIIILKNIIDVKKAREKKVREMMDQARRR